MGFSDAGRTGAPRRGQAGPRKVPRRITPDYLERAALHYLERYSSSEANLRRVLMRKVQNSCHHHGDDPASFAAILDAVIAGKVASGLIDDRRFAENRAASLERRGTSRRMIGAKLAAKGIGRAIIDDITAPRDAQDDLAAARIAARRKAVGPWRKRGSRADFRQKDIATLLRAGFALGIVLAVVDAAFNESDMIDEPSWRVDTA